MRVLSPGSAMSAAVIAAILSGCASVKAPQDSSVEGYCSSIMGPIRPTKTCADVEPPSAQVEADAKQFATRPGTATVYVVRRNWSDTAYRVPVRVDAGARFITLPYSFARVTLPPGRHQLALEWRKSSQVLDLDVRAGEVRFVEIEGAAWSWGPTYQWSTSDQAGARKRALVSKLIADLKIE